MFRTQTNLGSPDAEWRGSTHTAALSSSLAEWERSPDRARWRAMWDERDRSCREMDFLQEMDCPTVVPVLSGRNFQEMSRPSNGTARPTMYSDASPSG